MYLVNDYSEIIARIKCDINRTRFRIIENANEELISLYYRLGKVIDDNWKYGNNFVKQLSYELRKDYPDMNGFSDRNLRRMRSFYREYNSISNWPPLVANLKNKENGALKVLPSVVTHIPWTHNYLLIEKVKDLNQRLWYAQKCYENGWSKDMLIYQINSDLFRRQSGIKLTNFEEKLNVEQFEIAKEIIKDPYIFELSGLNQKYSERELEDAMISKIKDSLLELGKGFSFVGSQYKIKVGNNDYYIDLLFYHIPLKCYVVVELKNNDFKPEYIGQLNFYVTSINKVVKSEFDNNSIGLLLCKSKDSISVKWALEGIDNPIGVSSYEINKYISNNNVDLLPTDDELKNKINL